MAGDVCVWGVCFFRLPSDDVRFFGFAEFRAGLALMVLAWTTADARYRFRISTAPLPLREVTFGIVASVGVLTLATDLWRARSWWVPRGSLITPYGWQALLGAMFLATFLTWSWFAFIRPQVFGRFNAVRYGRALYRTIIKGDAGEISVVADEVAASALSLVKHCPPRRRQGDPELKHSMTRDCAQEVLLLLGDRRFCKTVVASSPGTILSLFRAIDATRKYDVPLEIFARNVVNEAISNIDSFVYHEQEGYWTGLIGYHKPLSQAIFSNYDIVEGLGTLLEPDHRPIKEWEAHQWEAYGRLTVAAFEGFAKSRSVHDQPAVFYRAFSSIVHSCIGLRALNGSTAVAYGSDAYRRIKSAVRVVVKVCELLDQMSHEGVLLRLADRNRSSQSVHDMLADTIFDLIKEAAAVQSPRFLAWDIQRNIVWSQFFDERELDTPSGRIIKFKVRRLLYDEVKDLERLDNYKGATVLGLLLNVLGLEVGGISNRDTIALQKVVLAWTRRNFTELQKRNPRLAAYCLVDGLAFDEKGTRLSRVWGLHQEDRPRYAYLDLNPTA